MNAIQSAVSNLKAGKPQFIRNLTVFPLMGSQAPSPGYVVLEQALSSGQVVISEISSSGSVPTIKLTNRGSMPVLILDGEELIGCKQNRIVNLTILAPAKEELELPVSCVEMGRWNSVSTGFSASKQTLYAGLRARKVASVSDSMSSGRQAAADQGAIWDDISAKFSRMGSSSASSAMSDMYENFRGDIEEYTKPIHASAGQIGAVFGINGRCRGIELFDAEATCAHYLPKIAAGYAMDALESCPKTPSGATVSPQPHDDPDEFLKRIAVMDCKSFPSIGLGQDLRLTGNRLAGAGLDFNGSLLHLCAFALENSEEQRPGRGSREQSVIRRTVRRFDD